MLHLINKENKNCIVTMAIGENAQQTWDTYAQKEWLNYAKKYQLDLIVFTKPLDSSPRAKKRHISWQKCLALSQTYLKKYEQVIWIDADIIINSHQAPNLIQLTPKEMIGGTDAYAFFDRSLHDLLYQQYQDYSHYHQKEIIINTSPSEYYQNYDIQTHFDEVIQCGLLVINPKKHSFLFEEVYHNYNEKVDPITGYQYNYEMRALSYEILKNNLWYKLPYLFNVIFSNYLCYANIFAFCNLEKLSAAEKEKIITSAYCNSYFVHFAGGAPYDITWAKYLKPNTYNINDILNLES